ncbi:Odorant receptor [Nesidiocoris tenuis]|uniref:Odorant receptor n=1 Tax=Nesidiocoris tenuis TaxID=355587 RepID=A0ABN7B0Y8_9HEMI|nr:Odorant receptor [Nesidiocoris tenuis]
MPWRIWRKKDGKSEESIKDQKDFVNNYRLFKFIGMIHDGSLYSKIRQPISSILLYTALVHHMVPLLTSHNEYTFDEFMDLVHLEMVYTMWCIVWPSYIIRSELFASMTSKIKNGLYTYSDELTVEEKRILSKANDAVLKITKISVYVYVCGGIGIFLKGTNKEKMRKLEMPNIGWFPFAINSVTRYFLGCLFQATLGLNAVSIAIGTFMSFAMLTTHYKAQFELLRAHLRSTFPKNVSPALAAEGNYKQATLRRLRDCYMHHLAIVEFHEEFLQYYGLMLLVFRISIVLLLCTLAFVSVIVRVTAHNLLKMLSFASTELLFVLLFSLRGQGVTDWSQQWREELYSVDWWDQPMEVRRNLKLMILGSVEPLIVYGVWKIAAYSHAGLFAIGNESFSFFNMLRALH